MVGGALLGPVLRFRTQESQPDVGDNAGPLFVHEHRRLARLDVLVIPVAVRVRFPFRVEFAVWTESLGRTDPHAAPLLGLSQVTQKVGLSRYRQTQEGDQSQRAQNAPGGSQGGVVRWRQGHGETSFPKTDIFHDYA
jgi:hypothetical protein